ncbi:MAG: hypothetical protein AB2693_30945 [Candidatus Thiodiazotropha sp.]
MSPETSLRETEESVLETELSQLDLISLNDNEDDDNDGLKSE